MEDKIWKANVQIVGITKEKIEYENDFIVQVMIQTKKLCH